MITATVNPRRTLFDITADLLALDDLLFETGGDVSAPEAEAAIDAWFAELGADLEGKADNYCALIRQMECRAAARREEAERLLKRVKVDENAAKGLKARLLLALQARGLKKIETPRYRVTVAGNGGKTPLEVDSVDPDTLPEQFCTLIPSRWEINKDAVRAHLENPNAAENPNTATLDWARLKPRGFRLSIR